MGIVSFPDKNDRSVNEPLFLASKALVEKTFFKYTNLPPGDKTPIGIKLNWFVKYSLDQGWDEAQIHGATVLLKYVPIKK